MGRKQRTGGQGVAVTHILASFLPVPNPAKHAHHTPTGLLDQPAASADAAPFPSSLKPAHHTSSPQESPKRQIRNGCLLLALVAHHTVHTPSRSSLHFRSVLGPSPLRASFLRPPCEYLPVANHGFSTDNMAFTTSTKTTAYATTGLQRLSVIPAEQGSHPGSSCSPSSLSRSDAATFV